MLAGNEKLKDNIFYNVLFVHEEGLGEEKQKNMLLRLILENPAQMTIEGSAIDEFIDEMEAQFEASGQPLKMFEMAYNRNRDFDYYVEKEALIDKHLEALGLQEKFYESFAGLCASLAQALEDAGEIAVAAKLNGISQDIELKLVAFDDDVNIVQKKKESNGNVLQKWAEKNGCSGATEFVMQEAFLAENVFDDLLSRYGLSPEARKDALVQAFIEEATFDEPDEAALAKMTEAQRSARAEGIVNTRELSLSQIFTYQMFLHRDVTAAAREMFDATEDATLEKKDAVFDKYIVKMEGISKKYALLAEAAADASCLLAREDEGKGDLMRAVAETLAEEHAKSVKGIESVKRLKDESSQPSKAFEKKPQEIKRSPDPAA
jgi:hypothetical protein